MNVPMIFDSWASYGPRPGKDPEQRWTLDHLLADLDFYAVAGALVRHEQAFYYDAMHANRRMCREIAGHRERLFPCWTVYPHQAGDFPTPGELVRMMEGENVRAVCLRPVHNGYPIDEAMLAPLAEALNHRRTLILTTLADLGAAHEPAVRFCRIFKDCPIVLGEAGWDQWRLVTALLATCANLYLEFHQFQANRAVEWLAQRFIIDRILFGSGLLNHSAGAARGFVDWSMLDERSVRRFAGENLATLLGEGPTKPLLPTETDELVLAARTGRPLPGAVLDAHCHVLDDGLNGAGAHYVMPQGDLPHMLELNRRLGIKLTAVMSWNGTVGMDVEAGNALIERVVQAAPQEIIGLSSCDPTHQTVEQIRQTCRRLHLERGFRGMKPYPTNRVSYADERYGPYWEFCHAHRLYGLLHVDDRAGGLGAVEDMARRWHDATFLVAHTGGDWSFARQVVEVMKKVPNVMGELTLTPVPNGIIEWLCGQVGADRILFGTDAPMRDPRPQLAWCVYTRLSVDDKQKILGKNFARILRQGQLPGQSLPEIVNQISTP